MPSALPPDVDRMSKDELKELIRDLAKRWLAHDGYWFQAVERSHGLEEAIRLDAQAWHGMTRNEAQRVLRLLGQEPGGGLDVLEQALRLRLYAFVNEQEAEREGPNSLVFRMRACRVQDARRRKGLPDFPCKSVGLVEYTGFASAIDPRIRTEVLACPPDEGERDFACAWRFTLPPDED